GGDGARVHLAIVGGRCHRGNPSREAGAHDARVCARHDVVRWSSAASAAPRLAAAVDEAAAMVRARLGGAAPGPVAAFGAPPPAPEYRLLPSLVHETLGGGHLVGCSAGGVIGGGKELEEQPGLSLTAAVLPDVTITPFHLEEPRTPPPAHDATPSFVLIPDPYTFDVDELLHRLDTAWPGSTVIGGLASGGRAPGANALFLDAAVHRRGMVGLGLAGDIAVDTIVAQGCRPIGEPMFITRAERNLIRELDGRRPLEVLQELHIRAPEADKPLFQHSLFLGLVMREAQVEYRRGEFLIRNLVGMDPKTGTIAVGALVHDNQVVQFHLRDAATSAEDLDQLLVRYRGEHAEMPVAGSLLFSCLGRGVHLYGAPDHDTNA